MFVGDIVTKVETWHIPSPHTLRAATPKKIWEPWSTMENLFNKSFSLQNIWVWVSNRSLVGKAAWNQGDMYCLVTSSNQATLAKGKKFSCHSAISLTAYIYRDATVVKLNSNNETLLGGHQKWMATKAWRTIWDWRQEVMLPQNPYFSWTKNSPTDGWVDSNSIDTLTMDLKKPMTSAVALWTRGGRLCSKEALPQSITLNNILVSGLRGV